MTTFTVLLDDIKGGNNMIKHFEHYSGQYREEKDAAWAFYVRSESIRDRSGLFNWQIHPHVHTNVFQIFFITSGYVNVKMTEGTVHLPAPGIIVIPPGNVHGLTYDPEVTGHVLTLDHVYLADILQPIIHVYNTFNTLTCLTAIDESIISLVRQIDAEIFNSGEDRLFALQSLIGLLFVQLNRLNAEARFQTGMSGLNEKYFHSFQKSYTSSQPFSKPIPEFAKELGISTVHLNRVCKTVAGKSASLLLQEHAVSAAKKLLAHTTYSVSEIAYQLNFADPGYFARLFKKLTGKTPVEYRRELT